MIRILITTLLILFFLESNSQSCLPNGITFRTQSEIDSFPVNYPSCNVILGNVGVFGGNSVTNLLGLSQIHTIEGTLTIDSNRLLTNLQGLNQLSVVGGSLIIGTYHNSGNAALADISALGNLNSVGAQIFIGYNPVLLSLNGLEGISAITEDLYIWGNPSLTDFSGLDNLTSIGGRFDCDENGITTFSGLGNLNHIGAYLKINNNNSLLNLNALYGLTFVGNELIIYHNDTLTSLKGLDSINGNAITKLTIYENYYLSDCAVQSICNYLTGSGNSVIQFNYEGCKTTDQVKAACALLSDEIKEFPSFSIFPNPVIDHFTLKIPKKGLYKNFALHNLYGTEILSVSISDFETDIYLGHLPTGLYFGIIRGTDYLKILKIQIINT